MENEEYESDVEFTQITHPKKEAFLLALEKNLGNVTSASKQTEIPRRTHYKWMENDPEYASRVEDISEISLDFAESALMQMIQNKNTTATIFYLKTKGKKRGYTENDQNTDRKDFEVHIHMDSKDKVQKDDPNDIYNDGDEE